MKNLISLLPIAASISICLSASASAALSITGTVGAEVGQGYVAPLLDIAVLSGSATIPDTVTVMCIDGSAHWPGAGAIHQYNESNVLPMDHVDAGDKALGMMNYIVDNYYADITTGDWGASPGYQFNLALWELTSDFKGTVASLSTTAGGSYRDPSEPEYPLYTAIVDDLKTHFNEIPDSYRSTKYKTWIMDDQDSRYQTVLMISPVPETSTVSLLLGAAGVICLRRRRP